MDCGASSNDSKIAFSSSELFIHASNVATLDLDPHDPHVFGPPESGSISEDADPAPDPSLFS